MKCQSILLFAAFVISCNANGEKQPTPVSAPTSATLPVKVEVEPDPLPVAKPIPKTPVHDPAADIEAQIASVQLNDDCPDLAPAGPAAKIRRRSKSSGKSRGRSSDRPRAQPCVQSVVQIAFTENIGISPIKVSVQEIRLLSDSGVELAKLEARLPTVWKENGYQDWDGQILPETGSIKTSYKLSTPDWSAIEAKIGGSSYGPMFLVEVDIEIDGKSKTVRSPRVKKTMRSPRFPRNRPNNIRT